MSTAAEEYVRQRDAALHTLDEGKLRALAARYGTNMPADDLVFWGAIHKARLSLPYFSPEEHEVSRRWLMEHGFRAPGL